MKFSEMLRGFLFNFIFFGSIIAAHYGSHSALTVSNILIYGLFILGFIMGTERFKTQLITTLSKRPYARLRNISNVVLGGIAVCMLIAFDRWVEATFWFFHMSMCQSAIEKAFDTIKENQDKLKEEQKPEITPNQF